MLTEQSRCRERDTCALISCCCSSTNDHRDSLKFVQEVAIFVNSHFFVSTQSLLLTSPCLTTLFLIGLDHDMGLMCVCCWTTGRLSESRILFFSRTAGRTSATSDLRSNVQPNWSHSRALDTLVHHREYSDSMYRNYLFQLNALFFHKNCFFFYTMFNFFPCRHFFKCGDHCRHFASILMDGMQYIYLRLDHFGFVCPSFYMRYACFLYKIKCFFLCLYFLVRDGSHLAT